MVITHCFVLFINPACQNIFLVDLVFLLEVIEDLTNKYKINLRCSFTNALIFCHISFIIRILLIRVRHVSTFYSPFCIFLVVFLLYSSPNFSLQNVSHLDVFPK